MRNFLQRVKPFFLLFIGFETAMRLVFLIKESAYLDSFLQALLGMAVGFLFDGAVFSYFLIPLTLYFYLLPEKYHGSRRDHIISGILFGILAFVLMFTCIGEWFFWDEFTARFNFIAVDYLVYTHEVIGNIRESYPIVPLITAIALLGLMTGWLYSIRTTPPTHAYSLRQRRTAFAASIALALVSFISVQSSWAEIGSNRYQYEIAKNGMFELFSAYRHNELDYAKFYATGDEKELLPLLRKEIGGNAKSFTDNELTHRIASVKPEQHRNIVMITVESLSGQYLGALGNTEHLTPYLDSLAEQSLFFSHFYATGTRTVYGLSALTLSIPPIPGNSIVRRPDNEHLFSLGSVLNGKGYVSKFIYGGFGYFDNMNYFFSNNGYEIVDRTSMKSDEITFTNIWGVADEDLFRRTIKENDKAHAENRPFFDMIMTTSNHRPFTYPDGKIDIPSHTGRKGGVKYTDYAIREFIEESRKHPWFYNTIFVIVADHTAGGAGKSELDPAAYHIPLIIYAPGYIKPQRIDTMASQIDVAPTLLGLLHMNYDSRFYGKDILRDPPNRALISNYQQLGYLTDEKLIVLKPVKQMHPFRKVEGEYLSEDDSDKSGESLTLSYFQSATHWKEWNKALESNPDPLHAAVYENTIDRR